SKIAIHQIKQTRKQVGTLYAVNTLGGVFGCFAAGFILLPALGIRNTVFVAIFLNLLAGTIGYLNSNRILHLTEDKIRSEQEIKKKKAKSKASTLPQSPALIFYGVIGFSALAYEVLWTRELTITFFSSTYSFTVVLTVFLIGLASGSVVLPRLKVISRYPWLTFGAIVGCISLAGLLSIPLLDKLPQALYLNNIDKLGANWYSEITVKFLVTFAVLFLPTFFLGGLLPVVCGIVSRKLPQLGKDVGITYSINTLGTIVGALVSGFILLPLVGVKISIFIVSLITLFVATLILFFYSEMKNSIIWILAIWLIAGGSYYFLSSQQGFRELSPNQSLLYFKDDISAEVKVVRNWLGDTQLYINEKKQGGTDVVQTERWAGYIPLLLHPKPESVLVIGLGTGMTVGAVSRFSVKQITVVELIKSLTESSHFFSSVNYDVLADPRVHFIEGDGVNYLFLTENKYDVILSDIVHPDDVGAGNLYSIEFYRACLSKLTQSGIFAQWVVLDQFSTKELKIFFATFVEVFPKVTLWFGSETNKFKKCLLVGSNESLRLNPEELQDRMVINNMDKKLLSRDDPYAFLSFYITDKSNLQFYTAGVSFNSIWRPILEYSIPKNRFKQHKGLQNIKMLLNWTSPIDPLLDMYNNSLEEVDSKKTILKKYSKARRLIYEGELLRLKGNLKDAELKYSKAQGYQADQIVLAYNYFQLGKEYSINKQREKALQAFKQAVILDSSLAVAHRSLGILLGMDLRFADAEKELLKTIELNPKDHIAYRSLGISYAIQKKYEQALKMLDISLKLNSFQADVAYVLGTVNLQLKNKKLATYYLRKSLEINPNHQFNQKAKKLLNSLY
ncbi:MAG: fused MFS/spermidine synthase, partial [bacterium]